MAEKDRASSFDERTPTATILSPTNMLCAQPSCMTPHFKVLIPESRTTCIVPRGPDLSIVGEGALTDLAVLYLRKNRCGRSGLAHFSMDALPIRVRTGTPVVALGSPRHLFDTTTFGIVSNADRMLLGHLPRFVQADAAINPGNSGGALVDLKGNLIGINSRSFSALSAEDNLSFAISWQYARPIVLQLTMRRTFDRGSIGLSVDSAGIRWKPRMGVSDRASSRSRGFGVVVAGERSVTGIQDGGLRNGDLVCKIRGRNVRNLDEYEAEISRIAKNNLVKISYVPGWEEKHDGDQFDHETHEVFIVADQPFTLSGTWFAGYLGSAQMNGARFTDWSGENESTSDCGTVSCGVRISGLIEEEGVFPHLYNGDVIVRIQFGLENNNDDFAIENMGRLKPALESFNDRRGHSYSMKQEAFALWQSCVAKEYVLRDWTIPGLAKTLKCDDMKRKASTALRRDVLANTMRIAV